MNNENEKISVVINTFNAEQYLERVLDSVKEFDEIVICDMHSADNTISIASKYNCKIVFHEKKNFCEPARNFAIQSATYSWILVVDADEIIPVKLRLYLYEQIKKKNCPDGIRIPRKNFFMGRFMHSSYPDYITRFARKENINWPEYIHSTPIINGITERIPSKLKDLAFIHLANDSVKTIIDKLNIYTEKEVEKRKNKRYSVFSLIFNTGFLFIKFYFIKGGFRDGKAGFIFSCLKAMYKFITIAKIQESQTNISDYDEDIKK